MRGKTRVFVSVLAIISAGLFLSSCAPVKANYPQQRVQKRALDQNYPYVLFENENLKVVTKSKAGWFSAEVFDGQIEDRINQLAKRGMPRPKVEEMVAKRVQDRSSLELFLKEQSGSFSFLTLGLVFEKSMKLAVVQGAFEVELKSPEGVTDIVPDLGVLFKKMGEQQNTFLDSRHREIEINWYAQQPDYSKVPNIVKLRLPKDYFGWEPLSVSVNSEKLWVKESLSHLGSWRN